MATIWMKKGPPGEGPKSPDFTSVSSAVAYSMRTVSLWSSHFEKTELDGLADKGGQGHPTTTVPEGIAVPIKLLPTAVRILG
jgi:hypothetical protein